MASEDGAHLRSPENSDVGLPFPPGTRFRFFKRLVVRLCWPFLAGQIEFNNSVAQDLSQLSRSIEDLESIRAELASFRTSSAQESRDRAITIASMSKDLSDFKAVLTRQDVALERHESLVRRIDISFDEARDRFEYLHDKVDLSQVQVFARIQDGIGALRSEIAELRDELDRLKKLDEAQLPDRDA